MAEAIYKSQDYLTVEAYLEGERHSEVRHEYFGGDVQAMAGASADHELMAGSLFVALHTHLKGKPCHVFKDGMKLRLTVVGRDVFYYPDVMVVCDPSDNHPYYREKAKLLIEVLSEDASKDLIEKFLAYQRIPSLEEYVVVNPDPTKREIQIFRRSEGWEPGERLHEGEFTLRSVGLTLKVADLYAS